MVVYFSWFILATVSGRPGPPTSPAASLPGLAEAPSRSSGVLAAERPVGRAAGMVPRDTAAVRRAPDSTAQAVRPDDRGFTVKVGDQAPDDLELQLADGRKTSLRALRGRVVVLEFTASWCGVCREEMPHLEEEVWQAFKNKGVTLIGVDLNEPVETVKAFASDMHITYPLALDPGGEVFEKFAERGAGVTRNVVVGPTGKIIYLTRLYDPDEFAGMVAIIRRQVAARKP